MRISLKLRNWPGPQITNVLQSKLLVPDGSSRCFHVHQYCCRCCAKSRAPEFEAEVQISPFFLPFSNMEKTTKLHALKIPRIVWISHRMLGFATALLSPPVKANSRSGWSSSSSDLNDAKSYQITQWKLMQLNQIDLPLKR